MPPVARLISLGILTTLIVALGITFYQVIAPFLLPLLLAWIVAIVCRPMYLWCVEQTDNRHRVAAGLATAALLLVVLLPLSLGIFFGAAQLLNLAESTLTSDANWRARLDDFTRQRYVVEFAQRIEPYLATIPVDPGPPAEVSQPASGKNGELGPNAEGADLGLPGKETSRPASAIAQLEPERGRETGPAEHPASAVALDPELARSRLQRRIDASIRKTLAYVGSRTIGLVGDVPGIALGVLGRIVSFLIAVVMFAIGLYYFLCDGPELLAAAEELIPVHSDYQRELLSRFNEVVRAVVLSTFLSALAQGVLTTFALGLAGFDHLMVFFLISSFLAMIPVAGTWLVWAPCAAWLVFQGQSAAAADYQYHMQDAYWYWGAAGLLVVYGVLVIGTVDNVIRTYILNTNARLHPLLAFVSVLGGLQVMGLWGVFIGPIVAACLHALVQIFNTELRAFSQERQATEAISPSLAPSDAASGDPPTKREPATAARTPQQPSDTSETMRDDDANDRPDRDVISVPRG